MTWYDDGVVPALAALAGQGSADLVLNVTGVLPGIAVELPCRVDGTTVRPLPQATPADRSSRGVRARRGLRTRRPAPAAAARRRRFGRGERAPSTGARQGLRVAS